MRNYPGAFATFALCLALLAGAYQSAAGAEAGGGQSKFGRQPATADLCGNGVVDAGEQCDDPPFNGDPSHSCCTATCQFAAVGSMCGCLCGSMVCDGADHCVICGDVDGSQSVGLGDALIVAQFSAGLRPCASGPFVNPAACDINLDGACGLGDALKMAQCSAGLISCEFMFCGPFTCP